MREFNHQRGDCLGSVRLVRYVPHRFCTSTGIGNIPLASVARTLDDMVPTTARLTWDGFSWVPEWGQVLLTENSFAPGVKPCFYLLNLG